MIKSMLVIIAVVACVAVAHPQTFYPAAVSYQNSFVHHNRQPYVVSENQGMGRFTNAHFSKQSAPTQRFFDDENQGMDRFTNSQVTKQSKQQRFMVNENKGKDRFENAKFARRDMANENQERDRFTNAQFTQSSPQRFLVNENQGMERFTNAHFTKNSNFSQRDNKLQYDQFTVQRNDEDNDRANFEHFRK